MQHEWHQATVIEIRSINEESMVFSLFFHITLGRTISGGKFSKNISNRSGPHSLSKSNYRKCYYEC
jgi:hypothetical protein